MVQSGSEGFRRSSQGLRGSDCPVRVSGVQMVQSGSEGFRCSVRV